MPKHLKIPANPDASPCRCTPGDPDCDHFDFCPECGEEYKAHEGHDCIDGVPVQDLRALSKELRDALDACETERDRLRAQIAALQSVPQGVELTDEELDAIYPEGRSLGTYHHEIHRLLLRRVIAAGIKNSLIAGSARLVPTPPQPIKPEERRVGPDEVVVGREEWEAVQEFADLIVPIRDNLSGISWIGKLSDVFAAYDRWYAVRISAQAHNGERIKHNGDPETRVRFGCVPTNNETRG